MPSWPMLGPKTDKNLNFDGSKSVSKTRRILEPFFDPFWDDFQGFGKVKNKGFVWEGCIFSDYQAFREKADLASILGGSWGGFWEGFGPC